MYVRQGEYLPLILDLSYLMCSILYRKFYIHNTRNLNLNSKAPNSKVSKAANLIFQGLRMETDIQVFISCVEKEKNVSLIVSDIILIKKYLLMILKPKDCCYFYNFLSAHPNNLPKSLLPYSFFSDFQCRLYSL